MPNLLQGGGGVQLLITMETYKTCNFPGGWGSGLPVPHPPIRMMNIDCEVQCPFWDGRGSGLTSSLCIAAASCFTNTLFQLAIDILFRYKLPPFQYVGHTYT